MADIITALKRIPPTLIDLYDTIYDQIKALDSTGHLIATTVFKWLLCAQRVLSTTEMLAVITGNRSLVESSWATDLSSQTALNCCCTLVVIDYELGIFRLAHPSVREYDQVPKQEK